MKSKLTNRQPSISSTSSVLFMDERVIGVDREPAIVRITHSASGLTLIYKGAEVTKATHSCVGSAMGQNLDGGEEIEVGME